VAALRLRAGRALRRAALPPRVKGQWAPGYIETIKEWDKRTEAWTLRLALLKLRLIPNWLTSSDFRFAFTSGVSSNLTCFERELMDHYRLVFERT